MLSLYIRNTNLYVYEKFISVSEFLMEPCRNIPEVMALINGGM